jgi:hypothetical protein
MFRGKLIGPLGFSRRGEYIGGRAASGGGPGGLTPGGAARAGPRRPRVRLASGPPPSHRRTLRRFRKNRRFSFYFVQF